MGKQSTSSVRLPRARAKKAPAKNGRNSTRTKYKATIWPRRARPSGICQAPPKPRLHQVHVPKIRTSESKLSFGSDWVPSTDKRNRNQPQKAAIHAAKARPGTARTRADFRRI